MYNFIIFIHFGIADRRLINNYGEILITIVMLLTALLLLLLLVVATENSMQFELMYGCARCFLLMGGFDFTVDSIVFD